MDLKDTIICIGGFVFGPLSAAIISIVVAVVEMFTYSDTGIIGCIMNMISTCAMIKTGKVYENMMINLKPTNKKLRARMIRIVTEIKNCDEQTAERLLSEHNWVIRDAVEA